MKLLRLLIILTCLSLLLLSTRGAELITNGGFESQSANVQSSGTAISATVAGTTSTGKYWNRTGASDVTGWTLSAGNVDLVKDFSSLPNVWTGTGVYLDLVGTAPGTISQSITTSAATDYTLSFRYVGILSPSSSDTTRTANYTVTADTAGGATLASGSLEYTKSYEVSAASSTTDTNRVAAVTAARDWRTNTVNFTATTTTTVIQFESTDSATDRSGIVIDDVSVAATP